MLFQKTDSLAEIAIKSGVPATILNSLAYAYLGQDKLSRAVVFAKFQTMLKPSDPNSWDTLGEMYWFLGEQALARHFGHQAQKIDPTFEQGGELVWQKNLEAKQKK